jgi:diacylglycerol kinase (ATP)
MFKSAHFIVNPNSGIKKTGKLVNTLNRLCLSHGIEYEIKFTKYPGHAPELAREAVKRKVEAVVVAGGDGTINEVLKELLNKNTALGIIPKGSGNGFARGIDIPLNLNKASEVLFESKKVLIDIGKANGNYFLNMMGVGLDAVVGREFNEKGLFGYRGCFPYFLFGLKQYFTYKMDDMELTCNGEKYKINPLIISIANGKQYGGGAQIVPWASLTDGFLNLIMAPSKGFLKHVRNVPHLFNGTLNEDSPYVTFIKTKKAQIKSSGKELVYHVDGETRVARDSKIDVEIVPKSLNILIPPHFEI